MADIWHLWVLRTLPSVFSMPNHLTRYTTWFSTIWYHSCIILIFIKGNYCHILSVMFKDFVVDYCLSLPSPLPPLHLATSEMWCWSGGRGIFFLNCLCVTVLCTIRMVHKGTSSSYRSVNYRALILLGLALSFECFCVFSLHGAIYIVIFWLPLYFFFTF